MKRAHSWEDDQGTSPGPHPNAPCTQNFQSALGASIGILIFTFGFVLTWNIQVWIHQTAQFRAPSAWTYASPSFVLVCFPLSSSHNPVPPSTGIRILYIMSFLEKTVFLLYVCEFPICISGTEIHISIYFSFSSLNTTCTLWHMVLWILTKTNSCLAISPHLWG